MARLMSEAEQRRRQKVQGKIGRVTSTLGLAGVGLASAGAIAAKKPGALKKLPGLKNASPQKLKDAAFYTGIASGGIGGVGGFNAASIYSAEARRRKQAVPVKKNEEPAMEMGYYGEEGKPIKLPEIKVPIEKAWNPSASNYDSESSRKKRAGGYQAGTLVGAGAGAAYAGHHGVKMRSASRGVKSALKPTAMHARLEDTVTTTPQRSRKVNDPARPGHSKLKVTPAKKVVTPHFGPAESAIKHEPAAKAVGRLVRHGGKTAAGLGAAGAALGAHEVIRRKRGTSWEAYGKRDTTSAFGIDHTD